jgi:hypothetical protein
MARPKAEELIAKTDRLFNSIERKNAESQWELLSEFILPNQSGLFNTKVATPGQKKTDRLYDSTAIQANHDLAAAIHATLTNPATKWSKIRFKDDELNNDPEAVAWLDAANGKIHQELNESNFDVQVSKNYQMYTSLGTMVLIEDEMPREDDGAFAGLKFAAWHLAEVVFEENSLGKADSVYRKFKMSARQAAERFGAAVLPEYIVRELENQPEKEFDFVHCIFPRDPKEVKLNEFGLAPPEDRPFASMYMDAKEKVVLEDGGFYEFPVFVVRWQTMPGEVYGRGPGHIGLPDIRTLNKVKELGLQSTSKSINPPLLSTRRNMLGALDLRPGKINVIKEMDGIREMVPQARLDMTQFSIEELRNSIRSIFFLDKLLLPPRRS